MKLYDRDYGKLLPAEQAEWEALLQKEVVNQVGTMKITRSLYRQYPKAARHFTELFPNHYLDNVELHEEARLAKQLAEFEQLLDKQDATERDILNFVNRERAYFLIGSLLHAYFPFGHHGVFLFPEFQLGNSYKVDHLIVGQNSSGWHFVFVELEAPNGKITIEDGSYGEAFRKGLRQVNDWETWLEARYSSITETFEKALKVGDVMPQEFRQFDRSRIHYVVVAGRRSDFNDKTYRICRRERPRLTIHYDNIVDAARDVIGKTTY